MSVLQEVPVLSLRVARRSVLTPEIVMLELVPAEGGESLPAFTPGAHIALQVTLPDGQTGWREYSLITFDPIQAAKPTSYVVAIRREQLGRGGSQYVHATIAEGDVLSVRSPRNQFELDNATHPVVLVAGGIGVTPLTGMAALCRRTGRPVRMVYAGRSRSTLAMVSELTEMLGNQLALHIDDEAGAPLNLPALFDSLGQEDHIYCCGPLPMIDAILAEAAQRGWPRSRVHFELFSAPAHEAGDNAFEVELAQSGQTLSVPPDKSILDVLIDAGHDPLYDCKRGECGVCAVDVLSGEIDHRDYILTDREKAAGNLMHICVSRCKSDRLVLDL